MKNREKKMRRWIIGVSLVSALFGGAAAQAAILGVPTNLNADGSPSASSANPPGWFFLQGTSAAATTGDVVHQTRLFIEVTGTSLDIRIFDPGASGSRDFPGSLGNSTTTYQLRNPCTPFPTCNGSVRAQKSNYGNEANTSDSSGAVSTDNRLVRFATNGNFYKLSGTDSNNDSFTGLTPGLYELRIFMGSNNEGNLHGVDIRDSSIANGAGAIGNHYNVFTIGRTAAEDTSLLIGASNTGTPQGNITPRMFFYPYVIRGCSLVTSNFDMDGPTGVGADITDVEQPTPNNPGLSVSGNGVHVENVIRVEDVSDTQQTIAGATTSLASNNYGLWLLTNNMPSSTLNMVDWRVADFRGWSDNPAAAPRNPVNPMAMYLPNNYSGAVPPSTNGTGPVKPFLTVGAAVASGDNPPGASTTTTLLITAALENPAAALPNQPSSALSIVSVTIGVPTTGTNYTIADNGNASCSIVDPVTETETPATCSFATSTPAAGFFRRTATLTSPATLSAGNILNFQYEVVFTTSGAAGLKSLTGSPDNEVANALTGVTASYFSPFRTTESLGPVCNLVLDVAGGSTLLTRASIRGVRVDPAGIVEFATGSQRNTLAFNIYGTSQGDGRGSRTRLNASPIAAPVRNSHTPILYRVETGAITTPYIEIEELDARGRSHFMGPYAVGDQRLREVFEKIEARLNGIGTHDRRHARLVSPRSHHRQAGDRRGGHRWGSVGARSPHGIKIEVSQAGMVRVPLADLQAQGLPVGISGDGGRLRLTNRGHDVEFGMSSEGLAFLSTELSTDYTGRNVYVLSWGGHEPPAPAVSLTRSEDPKKPRTVRAQENWIYFAAAPQGSDPWLWDLLFADEPSWAYTFDVPGLVPGAADVNVRIRLLGSSSHTHTVQASINGTAVGSVTFTGTTLAMLKGSIPAGLLAGSGNVLTFAYAASGGAADEQGLVYFDYVDLLDAPVDRSVVAVSADALAPYDSRLPSFEGADYLIVTHALFRGQAEQIAAQKRREGFRPVVVDVERAYDRYSSGIMEAQAVRKLITEAAAHGRFRAVLLVGDDTFDYRDYSLTGQVSYIPSLYGWDGEFGRIASENRYADLDGDGAPDLAIGRLPVQTPEDADVLVYKIARQTTVLGALRGRYLFAVDNQAPGDISFIGEAQAVINGLPSGAQVTLADLANGLASARQTLLQGLQRGQLLTSYFGHAGPEIWADEGFLTLDDLADLAHTYNETVLFSWACESQFFQYLYGPAINEALLLVPGGGALASFGPTGITDPNLQRVLFTKVYDKFLSEGLSLGEAVRQAKAESVAANPATKGVIEGWNLLGDPSLRLPEGSRARPRRGLP